MSKRLKLEYTSNDWTTNFVHQLYVNVDTFSPVNLIYAVVDTPSNPIQVAKGVNISATIDNIKVKLDADILASGIADYVYTEKDGNILYIYFGTALVNATACAFFMGSYDAADVIFTPEGGFACAMAGTYAQATLSTEDLVVIPPIDIPIGSFTIPNLGGNFYKINNDIVIEVPQHPDGNSYKAEVVLTNTVTNVSTIPLQAYFLAGTSLKFNISALVKWLIGTPSETSDYTNLTPYDILTNYLKANLVVRRYYYPPSSTVLVYDEANVNKVFVRAGERVNKLNLTLSPGQILRPTVKLPIWPGYPAAEYTLAPTGEIIKNNNLNTVPNKEYKLVRGCNNAYLKFLNQDGGYSYWLFGSVKTTSNVDPLGSANVLTEVTDFGATEELQKDLISRVEEYYMPLLLDLKVSPEVYLYAGAGTFTRVKLKDNTTRQTNKSKVYEVTIKLEILTNFNPSLLW